jgi:tetratricopeptide (TPR) repeat protein
MNANLNHTSYRMHELTRDAALQSADAHRLAREGTVSASRSLAGQFGRRAVRMALAVALLVVSLATITGSAHGQSAALAEPGTSEPYHPALVSFRIGIYYQDSGRHDEAVAMFTEMVEAFPSIAEGWAARADSYNALGEYTLAIADYTTAVELAPNLVSALNMRGNAFRSIGAFEQAVADYENAVGQMPEYAAPHGGLAEAYALMGRQPEALAEMGVYSALAGADADPEVIARVSALQQQALAAAT